MRRPRLSDEDVRLAFRRILRLPEARPALEYLQGVLEEIGPSETCALHAHNERRKFAAELIAMLAVEAGSESDGSDGPEDDGRERRLGRQGRQERGKRSRRHGPAGR